MLQAQKAGQIHAGCQTKPRTKTKIQNPERRQKSRSKTQNTALGLPKQSYLSVAAQRQGVPPSAALLHVYQRVSVTTAEQLCCLQLQPVFFLLIKRSFSRMKSPFILSNYRGGRYLPCPGPAGGTSSYKGAPWSPVPPPSSSTNQSLQPGHYSPLPAQPVFPSVFPEKAHLFSVNAVN